MTFDPHLPDKDQREFMEPCAQCGEPVPLDAIGLSDEAPRCELCRREAMDPAERAAHDNAGIDPLGSEDGQ